MNIVKERNDSCFELRDKPRMPVEPSSREHTPEHVRENNGDADAFPDVFCLCRKPEAGMMIECELCHEWYMKSYDNPSTFEIMLIVTGTMASV